MSHIHAAVIGTVFLDVKGFALDTYIPEGRNLGTIEFIHGGVGRNVAENMGRLGIPTSFVSSVDDGPLGEDVIRRLGQSGIDTKYIRKASKGMGMWLAILDESGDLAGSISQMPDLSLLEQVVAGQGKEIVEAATHVLLELDLNASISGGVLGRAIASGKPVYGIPGNMDVILKHPELLRQVDCFICNHVEAGRLSGRELSPDEPVSVADIAVSMAKNAGLARLVVTLGARGCVYVDEAAGEVGHVPAFTMPLVDSSGAGDAFFSGTAAGLIRGLPLSRAVVWGSKVAGWTIGYKENTSPDLADKVRSDDLFIV